MMGGIPVKVFDEMAKSAIAELCNMILGNAATIFFKNKINIDITPPTVLTGDNIQLSPTKVIVICIPIYLDDDISMELSVSYIENKEEKNA